MISPNRSLADVNPSRAILWYEGGPQFDVNGVRKTANLGQAPGAPKLLTMGNGTTASTFPTQLVGRHGVSLDGGDYIDTGIVDPFERTDRFTLFTVTSQCTTAGYLISSVDVAQSYRGIAVTWASTTMSDVYLINVYSSNAAITRSPVTEHRSLLSHCVTYAGTSLISGIKTYGNAVPVAANLQFDSLSATIKNGRSVLIGAHHNGTGKAAFLTGNLHNAMIFPWELTPQQVQYLDRYCKTRINAA